MSNSSFTIRDLDLVSEASAGKVINSLDTMLFLEAVDFFIKQSETENSDFVIKKFVSSYSVVTFLATRKEASRIGC